MKAFRISDRVAPVAIKARTIRSSDTDGSPTSIFATRDWLITEAGGMIGDLEGNGTYMKSGNIVAGTPKVCAQLIQQLAPHLTPALKSN